MRFLTDMMNTSMKKATAVIVLGLLTPLLVLAAPGIPHQFYGNVTFESGTTPDGLLVEAKVGTTVVGTSATKNGKYGINPDLLMASKSDGEWAGQTVKLYVAGIDTGETYPLERGGYTNLNLTVPGSVGVINKSATDTVSNTTVAVNSTLSTSVNMGDTLTVNIGSSVSTNATIEKIEKLSNSFFTGATAVLSGNNVLNAYEIKITGTSLSISVVMHYSDAGIDETSIQPYRFNGSSWVAITPFTRDTNANTITFSVGAAATPYGIFGVPVVVVTPPPSSSNNGGGGGGGGGGAVTPSPSVPTLSVAAQKVDANKDNKIDVLDFNTLMVNWGKTTASNVADFNGDSKVDVFDFNLLMINWTL